MVMRQLELVIDVLELIIGVLGLVKVLLERVVSVLELITPKLESPNHSHSKGRTIWMCVYSQYFRPCLSPLG